MNPVLIPPGLLDVPTAQRLTDTINYLLERVRETSAPAQPRSAKGGVWNDQPPDTWTNTAFRAKITSSADTLGLQGWQEEVSSTIGLAGWTDLFGGRSGKASDTAGAPVQPCFEANGNPAPSGTVVQLRRAYVDPNYGSFVYTYDSPVGSSTFNLTTSDRTTTDPGGAHSVTIYGTGSTTVTLTAGAGGNDSFNVHSAGGGMSALNVYKDGTLVGSRTQIDVATGDGLTLTVQDDAGNNWVYVKEDIGGPIHTNRTLTPDPGVALTFSGIDTSSLNRFINATHQIATQNDLNISREPDLGAGAGGRVDNYSPTNVDPVYYFGSNMQNNSLSGWLKPANYPDGAVIWIVLTGPSDNTTLTLNHLDANSTDGNRFFCFNQANLTLSRYQGAVLQYDNNFGAHGIWRVLFVTSAGGSAVTHPLYQVVVGDGIGNPDVSFPNLTNDGTTTTIGRRTVWTDSSVGLSGGDNNDVAVGDQTLVNFNSPASSPNLTGITNGVDGRFLFLWNAYAGNNTLFLKHNTGSSAGNRLNLPGGRNHTLYGGQGAVLWYDSANPVNGAWVMLAATPTPYYAGNIDLPTDWSTNSGAFTDVNAWIIRYNVLGADCVTVGSVESWTIEFRLWVSCSDTGGVVFRLSYVSGTNFNEVRTFTLGNDTSTTSFKSDSQDDMSANVTSSTAAYVKYNGTGWVTLRFGFLTNTFSTGTIRLQAASGTPGQTSTIYKGSSFVAHRCA